MHSQRPAYPHLFSIVFPLDLAKLDNKFVHLDLRLPVSIPYKELFLRYYSYFPQKGREKSCQSLTDSCPHFGSPDGGNSLYVDAHALKKQPRRLFRCFTFQWKVLFFFSLTVIAGPCWLRCLQKSPHLKRINCSLHDNAVPFRRTNTLSLHWRIFSLSFFFFR